MTLVSASYKTLLWVV